MQSLYENAKRLKEQYPPGTRIELISMDDSQALPPGSKGSVDYVDDGGNVHMFWDNGRTLSIIPEADQFRIIPSEQTEQSDKEEKAHDITPTL